MTTVLLFPAVLAVLVFVHELGHFSMAKLFDMQVDEFGLGFPPRAASFQPEGSETTYSLNWLPLGGFVSIFGENGEQSEEGSEHAGRSFQDKAAWKQVIVLVAGVVMNMILAFVLLSTSYMAGTLAPADGSGDVQNSTVVITRGSQQERATITPTVMENGDRQIGIAMAEAGTLQLDFLPALQAGAQATVSLTEQTISGFGDLISDAVSGGGESLSNVAGPVGIADLVGSAADRGIAALFSFVAVISINLAVLNLLPFPALDGGRIVFSIIEGISGRKIPQRVATYVNGAGMVLLLSLMLLITFQDIARLL